MGLLPPSPEPQGFNAMGLRVPDYRKSNALEAMRDMVPHITTTDAMFVIDNVSSALEQDDPYKAFQVAQSKVDLMGAYRLVATLLSGNAPEVEA